MDVDQISSLYKMAVLGGTFDNFHKGHEALILTACNLAKNAFIGVISDEYGKSLFLNKVFKEKIQPQDKRVESVKNFIASHKCHAEIGLLNDPYGPSITISKADVIIVSHETRKTADKINSIRSQEGMKILDIVTIPWKFDIDGTHISSSKIRTEKYGSL